MLQPVARPATHNAAAGAKAGAMVTRYAHRSRWPHATDRDRRRLLRRLLVGRLAVDAVPETTLVALACGNLLHDLLGIAPTAREASRLRARYEMLFSQTVVGAYEDVLDGRRKLMPVGIFTGVQGQANGAILTRHLVEEVLQMAPADVPRQINMHVFRKHRLASMLAVAFRASPSAAVLAAYPGRYHPWEFARCPQRFWKGARGRQNAIAATRWLFEKKLRWRVATIARRCSQETFVANGLSGMLQHVFGSSPFRALDAAYPGRFKPWDLPHVSTSYWKGDVGRKHAAGAIRWMIDERLVWSEEQVKDRLSRKHFQAHRLGGLLSGRYKFSLVAALEDAYPGRYRPWELRKVPQSFWKGPQARAHAATATRWLIEERLGWNQAQVKLLLSTRVFYENALRGMLKNFYRYSVWRALDDAYPGRYPRAELYSFGKVGAHRDPLVLTLVTGARLLMDAFRLGAKEACRRNGFTTSQYQALRRAVEALGVDGLVAKPSARDFDVRVQQAVLQLTQRPPGLYAPRKPRGLGAAAEAGALDLLQRHPGLGRGSILQAMRKRGFKVDDNRLRTFLSHYELSTLDARLAAAGGMPQELRELLAQALPFLHPSR